jgi:tetratricopeptide (TPR) repeat protein
MRVNHDENIENSCAAAQAALSLCTEATDREHWAAAKCDLANAYRMITTGDPIENEKVALESYQAALRVYTRDKFPRQWGLMQVNLGFLYMNAHSGQKIDNLLKAAEILESAVSASTPDECGEAWAHAQFALGMAFIELGMAQKDNDHFDMAQISFEQSLRVYTAEVYPRMWSSAESALGSLYGLKYIASGVASNPLDLHLAQAHLERALSIDPSINFKGERESELQTLQFVTNELAKVNMTNTVNTQAGPPHAHP